MLAPGQRGERPKLSNRPVQASDPEPEDQAALSQAGREKPRDRTAETRAASVPAGETRAEAHPAQRLRTIRGLSLDAKGRPVAHVDLVFKNLPTEIACSSDASGRFSLDVSKPHWSGSLRASGEVFATLMGCYLKQQAEGQLNYVVVAPAVALAGRVLDETGRPLEGVEIAPRRWRAQQSSFPFPLDSGVVQRVSFSTDAEGLFSQDGIPSVPGHDLWFELEGYESASLVMPTLNQIGLNITLQQKQAESMLRGRVVLPDLSPAERALVNFNGAETLTDNLGQFELPVNLDRLPAQGNGQLAIAAALEPYGTCFITNLSGQIRDADSQLPQNLELILSEQAYSITGKVVDEQGRPMADWKVSFSGGLPLSHGQLPQLTAESISGAQQVGTTTDGSFEFKGLLGNRSYTLWAYDDKSLRSTQLKQIFGAGEQNAKLVVLDSEVFNEVRGVVLSVDGVPQPGARVSGKLVTMRSDAGSMSIRGDSVLTDAEGRFVIENLGKYEVTLGVSGDDFVPSYLTIEAGMDPLNLRLVANRRCHFRLFIEGVGEERQDIHFLDAEGRTLSIYSFQSNGWSSSTRSTIDPVKPGVLAVSDAAVVLVVGGKNGVRHPIQLISGQVNELRIQQ